MQQTERLDTSYKFSFEEDVSVYELVEHPHFNYCLGDVVVRLRMEQPQLERNEYSKELLNQGSLHSTHIRGSKGSIRFQDLLWNILGSVNCFYFLQM